ncbi:MAG: phosphoribosylamine--glycine ligase [Bacteroidales bacterium]|nr:phosphoribosylamine--glycine ligase [Bacteroidales bacterium]
MKVLVIGRGGREHAIAWKVAQSALVSQVFVAPGNAGTGQQFVNVPIDEKDNQALVQWAKEHAIDLVIIGPEAALQNGLANELAQNGIRVFGPTREAAQIEASKEFAKELMRKYHVATADFATFSDYDAAKKYLDEKGAPIVIKYDGLAAGKGVVVAMNEKEADEALRDMLLDAKFGEGKVVMEEYLEGPEFSLLALVNGCQVVPLVIAQDHKRAFDGDKGPNTGGMGAYSPVSIIPQSSVNEAVDKIMKPVAAAMVEEGRPFCGVLYGGLMLTKNGPKVIEFNARFGDPETEVVLPKIKSDLVRHILDVLDHKETQVEFEDDTFLGVVLSSKGYPGSYAKGMFINGLEDVRQLVFHMGTAQKEGQWVTAGGRVLIVVGRGRTIREAQADAYEGVQKIKSDALFYRHDIGYQSINS